MPSGQHVTPGTRLGGRKKGKSIDLAERKLLTGRMAADLLTVYDRLGGVKWLLQFAKDNPAEFLRQGLSRLLPAPDKHDDSITVNQLNVGGDMSTLESAMRVAFLLAKATHDEPLPAQRLDAPTVDPEPAAATPAPTAAPVADTAARNEAWASLLPPTAAERDAQAATQQAPDDHHGGAEEQARPKTTRPGLPNRRSELL